MPGISYPLEVSSVGSLKTASDAELIRQQIFSVLETVVGEQLMESAYGTKDYLFDPVNSPNAIAIEIERALRPEVGTQVSVAATIDDNGQLTINVYYRFNEVEEVVRFPQQVFGGLHPDTVAYRDRILAAGGVISEASLAVVDQYLTRPLQPLKSKFIQLLPVLGNNLQAAQVALYGGNAIAVNHTQDSYRESVGLIGDPASSRYVNSQVLLNQINAQSCTLFFTGTNYEPTYNALINFAGAYDEQTTNILIFSREAGFTGRDGFWSDTASTSGQIVRGSQTVASSGSYCGTSFNGQKTLYFDGVKLGQSQGSATFQYTSNVPIVFQGRFIRVTAGTVIPQLFSRFNFTGSAIASYLDENEVALLNQSFAQFNAAMGRG